MVTIKRAVAVAAALLVAACVGTTGGDVVDFPCAAAGLPGSGAAVPLAFDTDRGWHVTLTRAVLHVGALYLGESQPVSGAQATGCVLPGTYVAQLTTGMDVDLLDGTAQRFPTLAHGTTLPAIVGQVWLTGGAVDTASDATPILVVEGTAVSGSDVRSFSGTITISGNRVTAGGVSAGSDIVCKQRIVTPIAASGVVIQHRGGLMLRVDPRRLFVNVDFSTLGRLSSGYGFSDDPTQVDPTSPLYYSQASANLYANLHSAGALYTFSWDPTLLP